MVFATQRTGVVKKKIFFKKDKTTSQRWIGKREKGNRNYTSYFDDETTTTTQQ